MARYHLVVPDHPEEYFTHPPLQEFHFLPDNIFVPKE